MPIETISEYRNRTAREMIARRAGEDRRLTSAAATAEWSKLERRAVERRQNTDRRENGRIDNWMARFHAAKLESVL